MKDYALRMKDYGLRMKDEEISMLLVVYHYDVVWRCDRGLKVFESFMHFKAIYRVNPHNIQTYISTQAL